MPRPVFDECMLDDLVIEDESSLRHVALYADLKQVLRGAGCRFRVLPTAWRGRWDRAQFLNLSFWGAGTGGDVLVDRGLPADVVAHVAWHHLAHRAAPPAPGAPPTASALFLGEAIASAFDLYLIGRLLGHSPDSSFLETQVPALADAADAAGLPATDFEAMLGDIARDPERAFADLRELLFEATAALFASRSAEAALGALAAFDRHRFAALLHHYELSNWVLFARAYARTSPEGDERVAAIDAAMRRAPVALDWLAAEWVAPALRGMPRAGGSA
ncbi:MAG: hypothetical protein ABR587_15380 [Candidatus Binatia bacterium]